MCVRACVYTHFVPDTYVYVRNKRRGAHKQNSFALQGDKGALAGDDPVPSESLPEESLVGLWPYQREKKIPKLGGMRLGLSIREQSDGHSYPSSVAFKHSTADLENALHMIGVDQLGKFEHVGRKLITLNFLPTGDLWVPAQLEQILEGHVAGLQSLLVWGTRLKLHEGWDINDDVLSLSPPAPNPSSAGTQGDRPRQ